MKSLLLILLVVVSTAAFGQHDYYYKNYSWKSKLEDFKVSEEDMNKDQVYLFDKKSTQFVFTEKGEALKYSLEHKIIQLNNDKAIENNNKYYVSNYGAIEVILQKARVHKPDGKIIEMSTKDIKTSYDEEGNPEYQYFAFEGIEVGSVIEYFHVMVFNVSYTGIEMRVQTSSPKMNVEHDVICPSHLEFKFKSINGLPEFVKDSTEENFNRYAISVDHIDGVGNEVTSAYGANIQKYYYMLYKNLSSGKSNFYNYLDVTKNIHGNMFKALTKKEEKAISKFLKPLNLSEVTSISEKVRMIEHHLKSNIIVQDIRMEGIETIDFMLGKKMTNKDGMTKMMLNCLRMNAVNFELVITCDRNDNRFVEGFEGYNFLQEYLIYITDLKEYYSASMFCRVGFPPVEYVHTEGLFIKEIKLGTVVSSIGKVKFINGKGKEASIDNIITNVKINDDKTSATVDIERSTSGYKSYYQSFIDFLDDDKKTEIKEEFLNYIDNETTPENMEFENDSSRFYGVKPFIGKGTITSSNFIEQGGNKILFKVGKLIGPQTELYNTEERKLPVEAQHKKLYDRQITFNIPDGYEIKNVEDVVIDVQPDFDNKCIGFVSSYELKGNQLIVTVKEWYGTVFIPVVNYKAYENVINAAADFNKVVLVLQPKV